MVPLAHSLLPASLRHRDELCCSGGTYGPHQCAGAAGPSVRRCHYIPTHGGLGHGVNGGLPNSSSRHARQSDKHRPLLENRERSLLLTDQNAQPVIDPVAATFDTDYRQSTR